MGQKYIAMLAAALGVSIASIGGQFDNDAGKVCKHIVDAYKTHFELEKAIKEAKKYSKDRITLQGYTFKL